MSRGYGEAQRFVLDRLAGHPSPPPWRLPCETLLKSLAYDWAELKGSFRSDADDPSASAYEAIRRAVASLERQGFVVTRWDDDGPDMRPYKLVRLS